MSEAPQPQRDAVDLAATVEELYGRHVSLVRSVCRNFLRNGNEAEDAVQQTFLSAQRALANGSSPREPAAWLATIARNECLARVQARMREPLPVDEETSDTGADAHTVAVRRHEVGELRQALAELPAQQRDAIVLRELRGLSYEEVASSLSLTTSAVESLIFRARRRLQTRLREALAAFSPGELTARILGGGGGIAAPVAAKVAALGVGTALVTGGAFLGTSSFGIGRESRATHAAVRAPAQHHVPVSPSSRPTAAAARPARIWVAPPRAHTEDVARHEHGGTASSQPEVSDTSASSGGEREGSGSTSGGPSKETEGTSSGTAGTADGGAETQTTSATGDGGSTGDPGSSGSSDSLTTTTVTTTTPDTGAIDN